MVSVIFVSIVCLLSISYFLRYVYNRKNFINNLSVSIDFKKNDLTNLTKLCDEKEQEYLNQEHNKKQYENKILKIKQEIENLNNIQSILIEKNNDFNNKNTLLSESITKLELKKKEIEEIKETDNKYKEKYLILKKEIEEIKKQYEHKIQILNNGANNINSIRIEKIKNNSIRLSKFDNNIINYLIECDDARLDDIIYLSGFNENIYLTNVDCCDTFVNTLNTNILNLEKENNILSQKIKELSDIISESELQKKEIVDEQNTDLKSIRIEKIKNNSARLSKFDNDVISSLIECDDARLDDIIYLSSFNENICLSNNSVSITDKNTDITELKNNDVIEENKTIKNRRYKKTDNQKIAHNEDLSIKTTDVLDIEKNLHNNQKYSDKLDNKSIIENQPLIGFYFGCTGAVSKIRKQLGEKIEKLGGKFTEKVTPNITHLICGNLTEKYEQSRKYILAKEKGIPIITEDDFYKMIFETENIGKIIYTEEQLEHIKKCDESLKTYKYGTSQSNELIGKKYERQIGYEYFLQGYTDIKYNGIQKGKKDGGIDLICKKDNKTTIIQCKYWNQYKKINAKEIKDFYSSCMLYIQDNKIKSYEMILYTTTNLFDDAIEIADKLNIIIKQNHNYLKDNPFIKCYILSGKKLFSIPTDHNYDNIKMSKDSGDIYCYTPEEAISLGHNKYNNYKKRF